MKPCWKGWHSPKAAQSAKPSAYQVGCSEQMWHLCMKWAVNSQHSRGFRGKTRAHLPSDVCSYCCTAIQVPKVYLKTTLSLGLKCP